MRFGLKNKMNKNDKVIKNVVYLKKNKPKNQGIKIIKLGKKISEAQFGKTVNVYNGVRFLPLVITTSKIGRSYKSFVLSKRQGLDIHKKKKKKI